MLAEVLVPLTLLFGTLSIVILPFGIKAVRSTQSRIIVACIYVAIIAMAYFMVRAGMIADETGVGGNEVPPFYGSEWYFMLVLTIAAVGYQLYLIRQRSN